MKKWGVNMAKSEKRKKYSCDFETTTDINDCRVWGFGWMEIGNTDNYYIGQTIDEFMMWAEKTKADLYFHNLRFDGEFIVNWLLHNGYTFESSGKARTFNAVISSMGQWYKIDIFYGRKGKRVFKTSIYDSLKKLPFPVKVIAKAFDLPVLKGDIDYAAKRPIGHKITEEEYQYIKNDIEIVARALDIQLNEQKLTKMTNGSDSLYGFKESLHDNAKLRDRIYNAHFPLLSIDMDKDIRKSYRGGFTWVNDKYAGIEVGEGSVYDVNSLYSAMMYYKLLPYGMPIPFYGKYENDEEYPLYIMKVSFGFEVKEDHIPTIQIKKSRWFAGNEYLKSSDGGQVELYLSNVDWELINDHYHVFDVEYHLGWKFKAKTGVFNNFIDKWMEVKKNSGGAIRTLAKLMLNSLYGKFASNPDVTGKIPYLKEDGSTGFRKGEYDEKDPVYTPMGVFITSYARETTIRSAQKLYDRILYCDTDSMHLLGVETPEAIKDIIDDKELGCWQHESTFKRGKFVRQKTYVEELYARYDEEKGKDVECGKDEATTTILNVKCAGMPQAVKQYVTFENFGVGFTSEKGKLKPKHVKGGQVLVDTPFTIK